MSAAAVDEAWARGFEFGLCVGIGFMIVGVLVLSIVAIRAINGVSGPRF